MILWLAYSNHIWTSLEKQVPPKADFDMDYLPPTTEADARILADLFASRRSDRIAHVLGAGKDGTVFSTQARAVVKIYASVGRLDNALRVYERLRDFDVEEVCGHKVPRLRAYDRALFALEMTHVSPPYVIDFAASALDRPVYDESRTQEWLAQISEDFGQKAEQALAVYHTLRRRYGIYHYDLSLANLTFASEPG